MPPRPVFDELNHPAASARCKALTGKGLSIQALGLKAARLPGLEAAGSYLPEVLGQAVARVPADDVLDAAAAAWTAHRIAHDVAECLPDPPQRTDRGQSIAIWY